MRVFLAAPAAPGALAVMRRVVEELGHDVVAEEAAEAPPLLAGGARSAFDAAFDALQRADLLVADASEPSHLVGWAVSWMLAKGRLVVLAVPREGAARVSPLLVGNPSPWQQIVLYTDEIELERQFSSILR